MILTFYYMAATCLQWYRLGRMKKRFSHYLAICNVPNQQDFTTSASDETKPSCSRNDIISLEPTVTKGIILYRGVYNHTLSDNQKLGDLLCYEGDSRCCTVIPEKRIDLSVWIGFSKGYSTFPFEVIDDDLPSDTIKNINLLLHASLEPASNIDEIHSIQIERFGIPIAWKVDTIMALIIRTDIQLFTSLSAAFMSKNIAINNHLQLLRIETVSLSGKVHECRPKDISLGTEWFKNLMPRQWNTHVLQLKNLCSHVKHRHRDEKHNKKMLTYNKKIDNKTTEKLIKTVKKEHSKQLKDFEMESTTITVHSTPYMPCTSAEIKPIVYETDQSQPPPITINKCDEKSLTTPAKDLDEKKSSSKTGLSKFIRTRKHSDSKDDTKSHDKKSTVKKRTAKKKDEPIKQEIMNIIENPFNNLMRKELSKTSSTDALESTSNTKSGVLHGNVSKSESALTSKVSVGGSNACVDAAHSESEAIIKKTGHGDTVQLNDKNNKPYKSIKPPNVLIYADSAVERNTVANLLKNVLHEEKYVIYTLSPNNTWWGSKATLLVVCGAVADHLGTKMLDYLLNGGRILCLCSDFINTVLPTFTTAEVRERELVRFSYDRWHRVRMIHHIFCYQPSPGRKFFSKQNSDETSPNSSRCPTSSIVEIKDSSNNAHKLEVKVLGAEDIWHTPSLISAKDIKSGGIAIFSQVHLEVEPSQYENDENIYPALSESNTARLDIIRHILEHQLNVECRPIDDLKNVQSVEYQPAYFLGSHELKLALLARLASGINDNIYDTAKLKLQFCGKGVEPNIASSSFLPILVHSCPQTFSTLTYFDNLHTNQFGRLLLYCEIIDTTMHIFEGVKLEHGMAAVARRQLNGQGRTGNRWLSPYGCAMFSLQLHIPLDSALGQRSSLVQILASVSVVNAIRSSPGYECIDLGLKWPNDIFAYKTIKVGGIIANCVIESSNIICNIGIGFNLNNTYPTTCINSLIRDFNELNGGKLPEIQLEQFLALLFNEFERLYQLVLTPNGIDYLYELYYRYWLHQNAEVTILSESGDQNKAIVTGIDKYGYLKVLVNNQTLSVQPDGNSFDMLVGLIAPKLK